MAKKENAQQTVTAAIYARYSSSGQNDASIEQQVAECTQYALANSLTVTATYEDRAMTGRNDRRPGFQRMIRAAERHEFQVLITYKSNRLARNMLDALRYESRLDKAGVKVVYCKENFGDNAAGRLALRMMMSLNEFYSDNLSEDVKRGMLDGAQKCKVVGAIPFGYKKAADGRFEIDEATAPIVREIYQRIVNGEAYMDIARSLNARGLKTAQGKPWSKGSFLGIIRNERYTGTYLFKDVRIEGGIPQIITREVYDAVQEIRKERNAFAGRHRSNNDFLLTGKLFCGKCLSPMVGISGKGRHGDVHYYYSCNGKRLGKICDKKNVRKEWIEEEVTRAILSVVLTDDMLEWIADTIMEMAKKQREASKIGYYESRLSETKKQIDNIVRAVEMGVIADEFKDRMAQLQADKQTLQGKIAIEKMNLLQVDRPRVVYFLETIRDGNPADPAFQKRIIRDFIRAVYLYDGYFKLAIDFTGKNVSYEVPFSAESTSSDEAPINSAETPVDGATEEKSKGLYKRTFAPPKSSPDLDARSGLFLW
ncbi:MAG: recombinase family protein [Clostridiales bacterium]|nr:recombinase family protein [Clostridiales bacterium]